MKRIFAAVLAIVCAFSLLSGCGSGQKGEEQKTGAGSHPVITMNAPYRNMSMFYNLVKEKYPEINLEIIPYNGQNFTAYVTDMRFSGQMTDIYFTSAYNPGRYDDAGDFLDLSGYDFTANYTQSRLREVTNDGAVYMLPMGYNALGITYNKTLLEKMGWTLPTNLTELAELKEKADAAGVIFCRDQLQYPGYGFQYLCNILDTGFLSTLDGMRWQNDFVTGKANVSDTPRMMEALQILDRWRELGMLNGEGTPDVDSETKATMVAGNQLFLMGNSNDLSAETGAASEFRLMPYLSEDGNQNVFILNVSRYVGLNKALGEAGNEQKLQDAIHVLEVISTVEGMESLEPSQNNSRLLPLKATKVSADSYYADILEELNSGHTASFIYAGWENLVVPAGEVLIDYACGKADLEDVVTCFDENQHLITDNIVENFTTATETIGMDDCARLVGISFGEAVGAEAALVSTNPWTYNLDAYEMNQHGVSGKLFPMGVSDQELTSILPTGWRGNIQTVILTGRQIKELAQTGFDYKGDGTLVFPYVLVTKGDQELDDSTTYTIPICGASDAVKEEGKITDSGILGLDAAKAYVSRFETLCVKDIVWE